MLLSSHSWMTNLEVELHVDAETLLILVAYCITLHPGLQILEPGSLNELSPLPIRTWLLR